MHQMLRESLDEAAANIQIENDQKIYQLVQSCKSEKQNDAKQNYALALPPQVVQGRHTVPF